MRHEILCNAVVRVIEKDFQLAAPTIVSILLGFSPGKLPLTSTTNGKRGMSVAVS
jgi:hypothetical protein